MDPNPYESPRQSDPVEERIPPGASSVLQLLTEIRDGQRELLESHRQALQMQQQMIQRTRVFGRFAPFASLLPIIVVFASWWFLRTTISRPMPPIPVRAAPPVVTPPGGS